MGRPRGPDRKAHADGYMVVRVPADEIGAHTVRRDGWMAEHRYVMERHLGRKLEPSEQVHHLNEDKHDNRLANLELQTIGDHASLHYGSRYG